MEDCGGGSEEGFEACFAVSDDPVSIWTTFLNVVVSAWTKVVGYGLDSDLEMCFGVSGGVWVWTPLLVVVVVPLQLFGEFVGDGFSLS